MHYLFLEKNHDQYVGWITGTNGAADHHLGSLCDAMGFFKNGQAAFTVTNTGEFTWISPEELKAMKDAGVNMMDPFELKYT